MKTRSFGSEISLVASLVVCFLGCTVKSSGSPGSGGDNGSAGTTGSGGSASGGTTGSGGTGGAAGSPIASGKCSMTAPTNPPAAPSAGATKLPCDIYAADGGPCVAAHSTVRALYATYNGPLYQVRKGSDQSTMDIGVVAPGGFAKSDDQDAFCGTDSCTISVIYDQSGWGNHLTKGPAGMARKMPDNEANAKSVPETFSGHKVYGIHIATSVGYRNNSACGTATGDDAETEYMVVAGDVSNSACCFDYGNMERNSSDNGEGTMEAVYFGKCTIWNKGDGAGPWVMGDLENGLWAGDSSPYKGNPSITDWPFVTGMVKGDKSGMNHWVIKEANAGVDVKLTPVFDGKRPSSRYNPMRKEGAIGLGTGGDNSDSDTGNWFEGVMTAHFSSDSADDAVQANIAAAYAAQ